VKFSCLDVAHAAELVPGRRRGKEHPFQCPQHHDDHPSLTINVDRDVWMCGPCHAKGTAFQLAAFLCGAPASDKAAVTAWLRDHGLLSGNGHKAAPHPRPAGTDRKSRRIARTYPYKDEHAAGLYEAVRYDPKGFTRRRPDGHGGWIWDLEGVRLVPYQLERLVDTTPDLFIVEGEKDVDACWTRGLAATCNIGGAGQWSDAYSQILVTAAGVQRACIVADHDVPGHRHAAAVARSLHAAGVEVRVLTVPDLHDGAPAAKHGRDLSDWFTTHDVAELRACVAEAPVWTPPPGEPTPADRDDPDPEEDRPPDADTRQPARGLDPAFLADSTIVAAEGRHLAEVGVPYAVDGLVPAFGTLGASVAFTKVGKTTFAQQLGAAVATGATFLNRATRRVRVLVIAAEDPPEYTAWLARHLTVPPEWMTFYRRAIQLDRDGLADIAATVRAGRYGLVLIASWQAVVCTLVRDENDNAGAVRVVENVKAVTRATAIPWLVDAHSGKGEDQGDNADPSRAMRGASGAASAADYSLSLRYANGSFGTQRRLSGKGRFVSCPPIVIDYDERRGLFTVVEEADKNTLTETTWRLILESGALSSAPQSVDAIARAAGLVSASGRVNGHQRRQVRAALRGRDGIRATTETRRGKATTLFTLQVEP
jgi:hypothetical protein